MLSGNNSRVRQLKKEIDVLLDRESTMWAQRSRLLWSRQGDNNTKYFNSCTTWRYRENVIKGIRYEDNIWRVQPNAISIVLVNYYKTLFSSIEQRVSPNVLSCVPTIIDDEMNDVLCRDFGEHDVAAALQQMEPLKSPCPD